ncbi:DUF3558 family protein [Mycobacteroides salmoniphilum]|uniref:DUF3558 family protein n=1 Tax=Mycobacteroides salmoniphilum TaxID=404941 RepID=UPI00106670B9|nr:DUF3558 family protein [Mycobacteroides salmoniphilum]TDZ97080.1 hypothetical protein CCUG62472_01368 [Mycobacteroides salmoniphilum]
MDSHLAEKAGIVAAALAVTACTVVPGTPTRVPVPTNVAGLPSVFFVPCEAIPRTVLHQQHLNSSPVATTAASARAGAESRTCTYRSTDRSHHVTIIASNNTLGQDHNDLARGGSQSLIIGGRRAIVFALAAPAGTSACEIDTAAITGIYGVQISNPGADYAPYPDCPTAARHYTEVFMPYFPY